MNDERVWQHTEIRLKPMDPGIRATWYCFFCFYSHLLNLSFWVFVLMLNEKQMSTDRNNKNYSTHKDLLGIPTLQQKHQIVASMLSNLSRFATTRNMEITIKFKSKRISLFSRLWRAYRHRCLLFASITLHFNTKYQLTQSCSVVNTKLSVLLRIFIN